MPSTESTEFTDDPRLADVPERDRASYLPRIAAIRSMTEDLDRAIVEADEIKEKYGDDPASMPAGQAQRLDNVKRRAGKIGQDLIDAEESLEQRIAFVAKARGVLSRSGGAAAEGPGGPMVRSTSRSSNPWAGLEPGAGCRDDSAAGLRSRAADMIQVIPDVPTAARTAFADAVSADQDPGALLARWALATGRDSYRSAFAKLLSNPARGHMLWTPEEQAAFRDVELVSRAISTGTGSAGGYMLPTFLDPTIMLTSAGAAGGILTAVRHVQTAGVDWHGVNSAGVSVEWVGEGTEAADASPTLGDPVVAVHRVDAFVPFSFEAEAAIGTLNGELQKLLSDALLTDLAAKAVNGTGTNQPTGLVTAVGGSAIAEGTAGELVADDLTGLQAALGARFQPGATFAASLGTINAIGSIETSNGSLRFPEVADSRLLRRPLVEDSSLAEIGDASGGLVVYGDLQAAYVVATAVGTRVELIPNLLGADGRPTGQRGLFLWARVGGDLVNPSAVKLIKSAAA